jgi:myo-inositol-1(or 4)-monophosphatase
LAKLTPGVPVWGEEFGRETETANGLWLVDPIDGTTNYSLGSPLWGVSIALCRGESLELGCVALPDLEEVFLAVRGQGVSLNGSALEPVKPGPVSPHQLVGYCESVSKTGIKVPGKQRCSGAFVVEAAWVATQRFRGMIGIRECLYDVAACVLIGQELGCDVRYVDGGPFEITPLKAGDRIGRPWVIFPRDSGYFGQ